MGTKPNIGLKFVLGFLGILLYMGLYALLFIPITFLDGDVLAVATGVWGVGAFVFFFPWFIWLTKVIWIFKGDAVKPTSFEEIKKEILELNRPDLPLMVTEKSPTHLIISWKYVDAKWWEVFRKAGMTGAYRLHVKFSPDKHEARLIDIVTKINWNKGPSGFHFSFTFFRGISMEFSIGKAWGIRENFSLGKIYDFKFNNMEIKNPVLNTLLRAGWDVRFALF